MSTNVTGLYITALCLHFPILSKAKTTRFWHHLSARALSQHMLVAAKKAEILQAMLHHVSSGYLSASTRCCDRLMAALAQEDVDLVYMKVPVEYGRVGRTASD